MKVVFHLAADHGGRGYIDTHPVECSTNLILDGLVFRAAHQAGVEKIVFASSGCVYPTSRQMDTSAEVFLSEDLVRPPYEADDLYGWAKLMGELTLRAYHEQYGMKAVSCRYFTAYGPRCPENHAVMAMIARAFLRQDPFEVWGTGEQIRNWTYIDDIVEGTIRRGREDRRRQRGQHRNDRAHPRDRLRTSGHRARRLRRRAEDAPGQAHRPSEPSRGQLAEPASSSVGNRRCDSRTGSGGPSSGISRRTNVTVWRGWSSRVA